METISYEIHCSSFDYSFNHHANVYFEIHRFEMLWLKYSFFISVIHLANKHWVLICQILKCFFKEKETVKATLHLSREKVTSMKWPCCKQATNRERQRCLSSGNLVYGNQTWMLTFISITRLSIFTSLKLFFIYVVPISTVQQSD